VGAQFSYDVVMLVLKDVQHDSRVRREAAALAGAGWRVLVIGTQRADGAYPDEERLYGFDLRRVRYGRLGAQKWWPWRWIRHGLQAWQVIQALRAVPARAYHAHDLPALLLVVLAQVTQRRSSSLVYDSHELYLSQTPASSRIMQRWNRLMRPLFMMIERRLIRRADVVITVCEAIARLLAIRYNIPRPLVIWNALDPCDDLALSPINLREIVGGRRYIVHTGRVTNRGRCVTELVEALAKLPEDIALIFLGDPQGAEKELVWLAESLTIRDRVIFVPPVLPEQVPATIRMADVAAVLMRPDSVNMRAALPIKFFEAVAAGVPVVTSNRFTLAQLVRRHHLGQTCDPTDADAIAAALRLVLQPDQQAFYRAQVAKAQQVVQWRLESAKLVAAYDRILHDA
jgi:glycosyltransferase involved in cell wall biosynthesis